MIVIIGKSGSGKSVQAEALKEKLGYQIISIGAIVRKEIVGHQRQRVEQGGSMPDEVIIPILEKALDGIDITQQFILEGFVRSVGQARWLAIWAVVHPAIPIHVFHLHISHDEAIARLLKRGRSDDTKEAITRRLKTMYEDIIEEVDRLLRAGPIQYIDIDGTQSQSVVTQQIADSL